MSHILLVTHWTGGDVMPFMKLGVKLLEEGHKVCVFSHCIYEEEARARSLEFVPLDNPKLYSEMNNELYMLEDPIHHKAACIHFQNTYHGKERLLAEYQIIVHYIASHCKDEDVIILARHRSSISGMLVAEKLGLKYASVVLTPNYFSHMDLHEHLMGQPIKEEINKVRKVLELPPISSWQDFLYSPKAMMAIWPEWFAKQDETWPQGVQTIGYLKPEVETKEIHFDKAIKDLLAQEKRAKRPVVLITGGSSKMVSALFYETAARACEMSGYAGILVTCYGELVPSHLPENIIWVKQVPLAALMKQVSIIIHHGGMGTLSEAVDAALPQIILPHLTDGPDNAQRLVSIGVAKKFAPAKWDCQDIAEAIKTSLEDDTKEKCLYYAKLNGQVYEQKAWAKFVQHLTPYTYEAQTIRKENEVSTKQINKPSKAQLLALLKRRGAK